MNPFIKIWFWLLILSIIGFIISAILFERYGQTNTGNQTTPGWIWVIFVISALLWITALILYALDVAAYKRRMEIAEACGELPPPPPKKKIECPKKECKEKKIVECVERKPCEEKHVVVVQQTESVVPKEVTTTTTVTALPKMEPQEEAFSAAKTTLRPLDSLAPVQSTTI